MELEFRLTSSGRFMPEVLVVQVGIARELAKMDADLLSNMTGRSLSQVLTLSSLSIPTNQMHIPFQ
jgi:hypothetical protein